MNKQKTAKKIVRLFSKAVKDGLFTQDEADVIVINMLALEKDTED